MRLLLIDLSSIYWTRWHATAGQGPDAAFQASYEAVQSFRDGHDATIICCDVGKSWRHALEPTYKANRPERDPAAYDQLRRLRDQLTRDRYPVVACPGYEADDVIATLVAQAVEHQVTIATGDKDLLQLVGPTVSVVSTNGGSDRQPRGPAYVNEKFGVSPEQLRDWLALVGDKSDNIAGCPGVGPKNATKLLAECINIDGIYKRIGEMDQDAAITKALREHESDVRKALELVTLSTGAGITLADALKVGEAPPAPSAEELPEGSDGVDEESSPVDDTKQQAGDAVSEKPALSGDTVAGDAGKSASSAPLVTTPASGAVSEAIVITKDDPRWAAMLEPRGLKQVWWLAEHLYNSQLYRKFANSDAIAAAILKGRSMGLDMMTALDCINVIEGKPTMGAMAIIGVVLSSGKAEYLECIESDERHAVWETKRVGRPPVRAGYTIERAEAAGLTKPGKNGYASNWVRRPEEMLVKQSGVILARRVYPDVVANVYDPDEFEGER